MTLFPATKGEDAAAHRKTIEKRCAENDWSATARDCLATAADERAYVSCAREEKIRQGKDMGGPDCADVVALLEQAMPGTEPDLSENRDIFCQVMTREFKECVLAIPTNDREVEFGQGYAECSKQWGDG